MATSRIEYTKRNIVYNYAAGIISTGLGFISRSVFLSVLSVEYLGVNGLFTEVLGVLSFAELGIGTALNYALYKPVAENDREKIKSLMGFYKRAYYIIAGVIAILGLALLPFLDKIVKDPGNIGDIRVYYLLFLFNTVISYFVSYKFSLPNAEQKNYLVTQIDAAVSILTTAAQMITLLIFKSFFIYLLTASVVGLLRMIFLSRYLNKLYPYLKDKQVQALSKEELRPIKRNIRALIWHKLGDISIHQTDNIIISSMINVTSVGLLSNYNLIISRVTAAVGLIFNSAMPSLGNLVAMEGREKSFFVFRVYNFISFWIYGLVSIAFLYLLTPTIFIWLGADKTIDEVTVALISINFYFMGQRIAFLNYKTAFGVFEDDRFVALIASVLNLVVSIALARVMGMKGVFVGTVVSGLFESISKPIIAYNRITGDLTKNYFRVWIKYLVSVAAAFLVLKALDTFFLLEMTFLHYLIRLLMVALIPNTVFFLLYRKTEEFQYTLHLIKERVFRR